jgi:hypothetical protein
LSYVGVTIDAMNLTTAPTNDDETSETLVAALLRQSEQTQATLEAMIGLLADALDMLSQEAA